MFTSIFHILFITTTSVSVLHLIRLLVLSSLFSRRSQLPQSIYHSSDEASRLANLHCSHTIQPHAFPFTAQHLSTLTYLGHSHFAEVSQQLSDFIGLDQIIRRGVKQHLPELQPVVW
jgi:hypothetical protein